MRQYMQGYDELFDFARKLKNHLYEQGKEKEVQDLNDLLNGYWSTASEALGDFLITFRKIQNTNLPLSKEDKNKLDLTIKQIEEAFDKANNPE